MAKTVLCADIGSSSLKAAVISSDGKILAKSRVGFTQCGASVASKSSVASEWKEAFLKAAGSALKAADAQIDAICISGNGPTLVSQDCTTLLWSTKVDQNGSDSLFIPRIVQFKKDFPESYAATEYLFSGPEYLIWALTGKAVTILPEDRYVQAYWSEETLSQAGLDSSDMAKLPPFVKPGHLCGSISMASLMADTSSTSGDNSSTNNGSSASSQSGTSGSATESGPFIPVYAGAPDFISALVGTNTLTPGDICDRAGSSEGINLCTSVPVYGENVRTLPSPVAGLWNVSYLIPDSGKQFSQFKARYEEYVGHEASYPDLVHDCLMSDGVFPLLDQGKYLMIQTALKVKDGIEALARAALSQPDSLKNEKGGVSLSSQNFAPNKFVTTGGQATNKEWIQMKANITGLEIDVPECEDAELLGNAVFTFTAMGLYQTIQEGASRLCQMKDKISPNTDLMF